MNHHLGTKMPLLCVESQALQLFFAGMCYNNMFLISKRPNAVVYLAALEEFLASGFRMSFDDLSLSAAPCRTDPELVLGKLPR